MNKYQRGDIWLIKLDPTIGSEINKTRPCVILSRNDYNAVAETVTVIPVSSGRFIPALHVLLSGLKEKSHVNIPQIRIASKKRLIKKIAKIQPEELKAIEEKLNFYLDLV